MLWLALAVVLVLSLGSLVSGFYIDILWFREVDLSSVFWKVFWSRISLALVFGVVFFLLLYSNLLIVRRVRPRIGPYSPEEEYIERYRVAFEPYARWVLPAVSALFALFAAAGVAGRWQDFQLWRVAGSVSFGVTDPVFNRDVGFYALSLPFQRFVQGWLFSSLTVVTLVTAAAHYLWGGIRARAAGQRVLPQVKAHLSVLLGLIVLVKAWGYRLGQFDLLTSPRGTVTGASYTDIHAQLPALKLLVIIAVVCAVLFLVNIRFRGWALPALGIGLLALTSVVAGAVYPAFIQRFRVTPQELQQERPFIDRNIEFTRRAFGLDTAEVGTFPAEPDLSQEDVEANARTVENIRLWNPEVLKRSFLQLERFRPYYEFIDVDVDRYSLAGQRRLVMIAPREVTQDGIPEQGQTWQNRHLTYTHGYGAVATRADEATAEGEPAFIVRGIPVSGSLPLTGPDAQPRVYFAETSDVPFLVAPSETPELDFPESEQGEGQFARHSYEGKGGIEVGGFFRRLAFAWRYRDVNLLISGLIESDSKVLINTAVQERIRKLAPFLKYDHDPYGAVVGRRLVWIQDAYTTTEAYPYSQIVDLGDETDGDLRGTANYISNSVKAVVDAYDGTTTFYIADPEDPIIQAWARVFPDLFTPLSEAPAELREHFRYPEDLFRVQAAQYTNYHVTDAEQFYAREDFWTIPQVAIDPEEEAVQLEPYYVLLTLPGETEERFVLFTPFTPPKRPNMIAWMAAVSDPDDYGRLVTIRFPPGRNVSGPGQVAVFMHQDPDVARETTLFGQRGSDVIWGDLLTIPVGQSFLYVQPMYLQSQQTEQAIPELKRVIVAHGNAVSFADSFENALAASFGAPVEEPEEPVEPEPGAETVEELLAQAREHFERAAAALRDGDLAGYQREIEAAEAAVRRAVELLAQA